MPEKSRIVATGYGAPGLPALSLRDSRPEAGCGFFRSDGEESGLPQGVNTSGGNPREGARILLRFCCGRVAALVMKIQTDYLNTPELTLTLSRAQQRFGMGAITCEAVSCALVEATVLTRTPTAAIEGSSLDSPLALMLPICDSKSVRRATSRRQ